MPRKTARKTKKSKQNKSNEILDKQIQQLMPILKKLYVDLAPLVLSKPEEPSPLPDGLIEAVKRSRIECIMSGDFDRGLASVADLVVHLCDASFKFPISKKYVRIYAYYANKLFGGKLLKNIPDLKIPKELNSLEKEEVIRLRRAIFEVQMKALIEYVKKHKEQFLRNTIQDKPNRKAPRRRKEPAYH